MYRSLLYALWLIVFVFTEEAEGEEEAETEVIEEIGVTEVTVGAETEETGIGVTAISEYNK